MPNPDLDAHDRADMARLAGGQDAALNDLMDRHAGPLFGFLQRMLADEDTARDLAQETFMRVFQHRDRFRPDGNFSTWLFTIAANLARNHRRWRGHRQHASLDAPAGDGAAPLGELLPSPDLPPGAILETAERAAAVRAAVNDLPEELRASLVLAEWEEKSIADIATILHLTPKAVETRLYRARQRLRERLTRWLRE